MIATELYITGDKVSIDKVLQFIKDNDLLDKKKLWFIDLSPDLEEKYMQENGIKR